MVPTPGCNILKSIEIKANRHSRALKKYATEGENIPLKKNWSECWCTLPALFETVADEFLNFSLREDDVFLVTFMKSGTTWMQECAWLLMNNLDFEKSKGTVVFERSPFFEYHGVENESPNFVKLSESLPSPRLIKTHLPANLLPLQLWQQKQKIIYVARNIKDVIVSSFHFLKNVAMWRGDNILDYVEDFLNNEIIYSNYWCHVVDFWKMRHEPFIFFVTYEEMKHDLAAVIQRLCAFLERPQLTADEMAQLLQHLSFENMKNNKQVNLTYAYKESNIAVKEELQFIRRGIVGSFKDELTPELQAKIDKWSADFLGPHGIKEEDIFGKIVNKE